MFSDRVAETCEARGRGRACGSLPFFLRRFQNNAKDFYQLYPTEIIDLKAKDLRLGKCAVIILPGKGRKSRNIPIAAKTNTLLESYLKGNPKHSGTGEGESHVFVNQKRQSLTRWGISYIINKYVSMAKIEKGLDARFPITPYIFRHSKSVHLLRAGLMIRT